METAKVILKEQNMETTIQHIRHNKRKKTWKPQQNTKVTIKEQNMEATIEHN